MNVPIVIAYTYTPCLHGYPTTAMNCVEFSPGANTPVLLNRWNTGDNPISSSTGGSMHWSSTLLAAALNTWPIGQHFPITLYVELYNALMPLMLPPKFVCVLDKTKKEKIRLITTRFTLSVLACYFNWLRFEIPQIRKASWPVYRWINIEPIDCRVSNF